MPVQKASLSLVGPAGVIAGRVEFATTFWTRMRGVLGRRPLAADEALVLRPCRRVHTFGVRYPVDAVFCDADLNVIHVETLAPATVSRRVDGAAMCIELAAGRARDCSVSPGVRLVAEDVG